MYYLDKLKLKVLLNLAFINSELDYNSVAFQQSKQAFRLILLLWSTTY